MTKTYFISGHRDLTAQEYTDHYEARIADAVRHGGDFVVGDAQGADAIAQLQLAELLQHEPRGIPRVTVYHMFVQPRNNHGQFPQLGGFVNDQSRDAQMTADSDEDIAWVRPGRESSGTAQNIHRRDGRPTDTETPPPTRSIVPGAMLQVLYNVERTWLRELVTDPGSWSTLDVDYEPPRVERLWRQLGDGLRVFLHRIHPCEKALFHPHPWPSAVHVLSGSYLMEIGHGAGQQEPGKSATAIFEAGSRYEMIDPDSWHSVRPLRGPSLSVMVTGRPWNRWSPKPKGTLLGLRPGVREELLALFEHELRRMDYGGLPYDGLFEKRFQGPWFDKNNVPVP